MRGSKAKVLRRMAAKVATMPNQRHVETKTGEVKWVPGCTKAIYRRWKQITPEGHTPFTDRK